MFLILYTNYFSLHIQDFDDTAHSFLSVSLMTPTGSPTHTVGGPDPISPRGHDHTQQSIYDQVSSLHGTSFMDLQLHQWFVLYDDDTCITFVLVHVCV